MWIGDKINYTPEETIVRQLEPKPAIVEAVGVSGELTIRFPDNTTARVPSHLCKPA